MKAFPLAATVIAALVTSLPAAAQQEQVNVICSVQADWCNMIQTAQ